MSDRPNKLSSFFDSITRNHFSVYIVFIITAIVVRGLLCIPLVIGHDESTYLVIANEWLKGNIPFVHYIDIKPVGIYIIFMLSTLFFGKSVLAIRLITLVVVASTGFFLYRAKFAYDQNKRYAFWTGLVYILFLSANDLGWTSNNEIFFVFFTALCLWKIQSVKSYFDYALFGLLMGLGFIIKYHVMFDALAFGIYLLCRENVQVLKRLTGLALAVFMFVLPFGLGFVLYSYFGYREEFIHASFVIPGSYQHSMSFGRQMGFIGQFYIYYLPFIPIYIMSIYHQVKGQRVLSFRNILFFIWPILVWVAVLMTGKRFYHYYIQALLPFCFFLFDGLRYANQKLTLQTRQSIIVTALIAIVALSLVRQIRDLGEGEETEEVYAFLKTKVNAETRIYTLNYTVLYYLLDISPPVKYVHASLLYRPDHINAFHIDVEKEFAKIKAAKPEYIVYHEGAETFMDDWLEKEYEGLKTFPGGTMVLRAKNITE